MKLVIALSVACSVIAGCAGAPPAVSDAPPKVDTPTPEPPPPPVSAIFCRQEYRFDVTEIVCNDAEVSDLAPITQFPGLERLVLHRTQIVDFSPLRDLPALRSLVISGGSVTDLAELGALTGLVSLSLVYTDVKDVSFVGGMSQLEELLMHNTSVADLQPVSQLKNLRILSVGPGVVSVAPLLGLTKLEELVLVEAKVPKAQLNRLKKGIPRLKIID